MNVPGIEIREKSFILHVFLEGYIKILSKKSFQLIQAYILPFKIAIL